MRKLGMAGVRGALTGVLLALVLGFGVRAGSAADISGLLIGGEGPRQCFPRQDLSACPPWENQGIAAVKGAALHLARSLAESYRACENTAADEATKQKYAVIAMLLAGGPPGWEAAAAYGASEALEDVVKCLIKGANQASDLSEAGKADVDKVIDGAFAAYDWKGSMEYTYKLLHLDPEALRGAAEIYAYRDRAADLNSFAALSEAIIGGPAGLARRAIEQAGDDLRDCRYDTVNASLKSAERRLDAFCRTAGRQYRLMEKQNRCFAEHFMEYLVQDTPQRDAYSRNQRTLASSLGEIEDQLDLFAEIDRLDTALEHGRTQFEKFQSAHNVAVAEAIDALDRNEVATACAKVETAEMFERWALGQSGSCLKRIGTQADALEVRLNRAGEMNLSEAGRLLDEIDAGLKACRLGEARSKVGTLDVALKGSVGLTGEGCARPRGLDALQNRASGLGAAFERAETDCREAPTVPLPASPEEAAPPAATAEEPGPESPPGIAEAIERAIATCDFETAGSLLPLLPAGAIRDALQGAFEAATAREALTADQVGRGDRAAGLERFADALSFYQEALANTRCDEWRSRIAAAIGVIAERAALALAARARAAIKSCEFRQADGLIVQLEWLRHPLGAEVRGEYDGVVQREKQTRDLWNQARALQLDGKSGRALARLEQARGQTRCAAYDDRIRRTMAVISEGQGPADDALDHETAGDDEADGDEDIWLSRWSGRLRLTKIAIDGQATSAAALSQRIQQAWEQAQAEDQRRRVQGGGLPVPGAGVGEALGQSVGALVVGIMQAVLQVVDQGLDLGLAFERWGGRYLASIPGMPPAPPGDPSEAEGPILAQIMWKLPPFEPDRLDRLIARFIPPDSPGTEVRITVTALNEPADQVRVTVQIAAAGLDENSVRYLGGTRLDATLAGVFPRGEMTFEQVTEALERRFGEKRSGTGG